MDSEIDEILDELFYQGYYEGRGDEYAKGKAAATYEAKVALAAHQQRVVATAERGARIDELKNLLPTYEAEKLENDTEVMALKRLVELGDVRPELANLKDKEERSEL